MSSKGIHGPAEPRRVYLSPTCLIYWSVQRQGPNILYVHITFSTCLYVRVLNTNIDQKLVKSLHGLLNCELAELDCQVITTEYRTCVQCIHVYQLFCNALVRVIYFGSIWSMYSYNTWFFLWVSFSLLQQAWYDGRLHVYLHLIALLQCLTYLNNFYISCLITFFQIYS